MSELLADSQPSSFRLGDVFHALFKHKWKVVIGALLGLVAGAAVYGLSDPVYESNAKLLVRYVVDRSSVDADASANVNSRAALNVIGSEMEILTSWDLAVEVVDSMGAKKLLPGSDDGARLEAAATVARGLKVTAAPDSNILFVSYKNRDPQLATQVLSELVNRYFNKHLEVHRSAGAFDFVTQQTDQVRARLNETEDALKNLKAKAGIISLEDSNAAVSADISRLEDEFHTAEAEFLEQRARVKQMEEASTADADPATKSNIRPPTSNEVETYKALVERLAQMRQSGLALRSKYAAANPLVRLHEAELENLEAQREKMEKKSPELVATPEGANVPTLIGEKTKLAGMEAKMEALKSRVANVRARVNELSEVGTQIADLERNRELLIENYKYFKNTLEKARIDEALDPSKMPNISTVQRPSPPHRVYGKTEKMALGVAGGGLGLAVALILLSELILNRSVKRPLELEKRLGTPLLLSIPYSPNGNGRLSLPGQPDGGNGSGKRERAHLPPWEVDHFIRPFAVAIRDRLGLYFELNRMTHKPKLVGVTGFVEGAGASTLAAGLAAALSEMGDGKVLLVDVNLGPHEVHPFFNGRPAATLHNAIRPDGEKSPPAADNLYLATVAQPTDGPAQLGLKKFFDMMPNLKSSDFDYVIFDMPPLGQTSPTLGMAGFMDKLLLVVEAETGDRDTVKRGYQALTAQRDNVSVVFNKARSYTPKWLNSES